MDCRECFGAVDCMNIRWNNCPFQLKVQYNSNSEIYLYKFQVEDWADDNPYVWNWFSDSCGTKNDNKMVEISPLFK